MTEPLVSVVIPAYNAAPWLQDAVTSVLGQQHHDLEVIIVNDGSTDATHAVANAFQDPRVIVIDKSNGGVSAARNAGIEVARGTYFSFLDADDTMLPDNLKMKLSAMVARKVDWVFGDLMLCDAQLLPSVTVVAGTDGDVLRTILLGRHPAVPAPCSNIVAHRRCFEQGLRFDEELSNAADQDIVLRLAQSFSYAHIPRVLTHYRVLPDSMSRNIALYEQDHLRLMDKARRTGLMNDPAFQKRCMANAFWAIGGSWWVNGRNKRKALPYILKALWLDPGMVYQKAKGRMFKF